jgi:formamidopyrimidine-DNA glycosylase
VPELPEVETIVRDVAPRLVGRRIRTARLTKSDVLRQVSRRRLLDTLTGNTVVHAQRRAKHAVFLLKSGHRLVVQPRMTGSLIVYDRRLTADEARYAVLVCTLAGGGQFVYRDVRRLGTVWLLDDRGWARYTARIGPEPLEPSFTVERFANRLTPDERGELHAAILDVLRRALRASGTTVRDYRTGTGERGSFQLELKAYDRGGEPCLRCGHRMVTTHVIDGRQTTLCAFCQR